MDSFLWVGEDGSGSMSSVNATRFVVPVLSCLCDVLSCSVETPSTTTDGCRLPSTTAVVDRGFRAGQSLKRIRRNGVRVRLRRETEGLSSTCLPMESSPFRGCYPLLDQFLKFDASLVGRIREHNCAHNDIIHSKLMSLWQAAKCPVEISDS